MAIIPASLQPAGAVSQPDVRLLLLCWCAAQMADDAPCHIGMVTTWSGDLWGIRREMLPWITYHAQLGVSKLYVLYDGNDRNTHTVCA